MGNLHWGDRVSHVRLKPGEGGSMDRKVARGIYRTVQIWGKPGGGRLTTREMCE